MEVFKRKQKKVCNMLTADIKQKFIHWEVK